MTFSYEPLHTAAGQLQIHQFYADTTHNGEDIPKVRADRDGWWEQIKGICAVGIPW